LLLAVLAVCWHSYSYSEYVYETSPNAASDSMTWTMANVLPPYLGLAVNGVFYRYTTVKDTDADMQVHVSNQNAVDGGYIFRETNDWSGIPQNTISRAVPMPYVDAEYWGDGSIEIEGDGQVVDPVVIYTYRYDDKCVVDPQSDPNCPGYRDFVIPDTPEYEVNADTIEQDERDRQQTFQDEEQEQRDFERMKDKEKKKTRLSALEALLGNIVLNDLQGASNALHAQLISLNYLTPAYDTFLPDPGYDETIVLDDAELPDNDRVRRNFAQDALHQQLVDSQYQPRSTK
jgi:hypothetical protein